MGMVNRNGDALAGSPRLATLDLIGLELALVRLPVTANRLGDVSAAALLLAIADRLGIVCGVALPLNPLGWVKFTTKGGIYASRGSLGFSGGAIVTDSIACGVVLSAIRVIFW